MNQRSGDRQGERQLRAVQLCYDYVYLCARHNARAPLSPAESTRLQVLLRVLQNDDSDRRRHRRIALGLAVQVKAAAGTQRARLTNLSGSGMHLEVATPLVPGDTVQIVLGIAGHKRYTFPCRVVRCDERGSCGLVFEGVPLEIRYGTRPQRATALSA